MADNPTEFVSFAFREVPAFFSFDDASVILSGTSTNLLADPGFEAATDGQNCNHNNSLGCPPGWNAWIQPIDTSAIGQVATNSNLYGCGFGSADFAHSGTNLWCDGSVQGYDAVYQQLSGLTVGDPRTMSAGTWETTPVSRSTTRISTCWSTRGTISLSAPSRCLATPEPSSVLLLASVLPALAGFGALRMRKGRK